MSRDLAERLALHYVTAIECDHDAKTDIVRCNCSVWTGTPQPSVGAAVREWVAHVLAESTPAAPDEEGLRERIVTHLGPQRLSMYSRRDLDMMARGAFIDRALASQDKS